MNLARINTLSILTNLFGHYLQKMSVITYFGITFIINKSLSYLRISKQKMPIVELWAKPYIIYHYR